MTDQTPVPAGESPRPFAKRDLIALLPAMLAMYAVYQGIQQILLPAQVEEIDPARKVANLATLSIVSSVAGTIALPVGGAVSDRTHSRFGRRAPWMAVAALLGAGLTVVMGLMSTTLGLVIACGALWFVMNFYQAVINAVVPDRIPPRLRGTASSVVGLAVPVGILIALNVVSRTPQVVGYAILGVAFLVATAIFVVAAPDSPSYRRDATAPTTVSVVGRTNPLMRAGRIFRSFGHPDFTLVFLSRIVFFFGVFAVSSYTYYIVTDHIGMKNIPIATPAEAVSVISSISTAAQVVAVALMGWLADRLDRRKLVVGVGSLGTAAGFLLPLLFPTWGGMMGYAIVFGASSGVCFALDLALMSLVLPSAGDAGRDLGLLAIAGSVPAAAPAVSAGLILATGTYASLFVFGIACAVVGAILVLLVRSVR